MVTASDFPRYVTNKLIGQSLLRRIRAAVPERNEHVDAFQELTRSLPKDSVANWKCSVEAWEQGRKKENPFESKGTGKSSPFTIGTIDIFPVAVGVAAVKLALLQQESQEIQQGAITVLDSTVSHSVLIAIGLDLEELQ